MPSTAIFQTQATSNVVTQLPTFLPSFRTASGLCNLRAILDLPICHGISFVSIHACSTDLWQEFSDSLLIYLVFRVLLRAEQLCEPGTSLEEDQIRERSSKTPVYVGLRLPAGPLVQGNPHGLLGSEVGMTRPCPEPTGIESAIELLTCISVVFWYFCRLLVSVLGAVIIPLLLVGKELDEDEHKDKL